MVAAMVAGIMVAAITEGEDECVMNKEITKLMAPC